MAVPAENSIIREIINFIGGLVGLGESMGLSYRPGVRMPLDDFRRHGIAAPTQSRKRRSAVWAIFFGSD